MMHKYFRRGMPSSGAVGKDIKMQASVVREKNKELSEL